MGRSFWPGGRESPARRVRERPAETDGTSGAHWVDRNSALRAGEGAFGHQDRGLGANRGHAPAPFPAEATRGLRWTEGRARPALGGEGDKHFAEQRALRFRESHRGWTRFDSARNGMLKLKSAGSTDSNGAALAARSRAPD